MGTAEGCITSNVSGTTTRSNIISIITTNQGTRHSLVTSNAFVAGVSYASIQMPLISTKSCSTTITKSAPVIRAISSSAVEISSTIACIVATSTAMATSLFTASSTITTSAGNTSSAVTGPTIIVGVVRVSHNFSVCLLVVRHGTTVE